MCCTVCIFFGPSWTGIASPVREVGHGASKQCHRRCTIQGKGGRARRGARPGTRWESEGQGSRARGRGATSTTSRTQQPPPFLDFNPVELARGHHDGCWGCPLVSCVPHVLVIPGCPGHSPSQAQAIVPGAGHSPRLRPWSQAQAMVQGSCHSSRRRP